MTEVNNKAVRDLMLNLYPKEERINFEGNSSKATPTEVVSTTRLEKKVPPTTQIATHNDTFIHPYLRKQQAEMSNNLKKWVFALMISIFWFGIRLSKETIITTSIPGFAYAIALLVAVAKIWKRYSLMVAFLALFYFPLTHIVYGTKFIRGFFSRRPFRSALR